MDDKELEEEVSRLEAKQSSRAEYNDGVGGLLDLEQELRTIDGSEGDPSETFTPGIVVGAERVLSIPAGYPVTTSSDKAIALDVRLSTGHITTVYTDWPETATDGTPITRLLSEFDLSLATFGDLYGQEIPLKRVNGHYALSPSPDSTLNSSWWVYGIIASLVLWMGIWLAPTNLELGGLTILVSVIFPVITYFDTRYVRSNSTWDPNQYLWPILMFLWIINIPAGLVYLYKRKQAEFRPQYPLSLINFD